MSNRDDHEPDGRETNRLLALLSLSVILLVATLAGLFALISAYKLGQAHPRVEMYCANDPDLPSDVALIASKPGNEAAPDTGIYYERKSGIVRIIFPWCGSGSGPSPNAGPNSGPSPGLNPSPGGLDPSSKFYRDTPAGRAPLPADQDPYDNASNGSSDGPQIGVSQACKQDPSGDACRADRRDALACNDKSKSWFNQGEADMADGDTRQARYDFEQAISYGRDCGSQYASMAAKQLAALNLPCEYTTDSLARISLDARANPARGQVIPLANRKQALKALGYYDGPLDSVYGPNTRAAIQRFERDLGFEETGDLTPIETVYLICSAAQNANNKESVNVLGIMYVTGLGVVQNTDTGVTWLKKAAVRGEPSALFNLAVIYGTGIILSSYQLCDLPQDFQIADSYLKEAAASGQPRARYYWGKYAALSSPQRWAKIRIEELGPADSSGQPINPPIYLQDVGRGCKVNPSGPIGQNPPPAGASAATAP